MSTTITISDTVTVGDLADKLSLPVTKLITELFKNGIMATINEKIDSDTARILVGELGLDVKLIDDDKSNETTSFLAKSNHPICSQDAGPRPPVIAVMGHVDHGKTSLLDVIRGDDVAMHEAGGITQHISAYQINRHGRLMTFLDTPGHEAFAALREHGAHLTDVVIIVIAADDGMKPQTLEAIRFARQAAAKIVIAITKIDKETANVERIKQQLVEQKLTPEEWGGDTVVVPVSSKTKAGIDKLLDMVLLVADLEELKADVAVPGEGLIIESHMEQGRGPIAVALIQQGCVSLNDYIATSHTYAKVRILEDTTGQSIASASPSTPIIISGFKTLPEFGDRFMVVNSEKQARLMSTQQLNRSADKTNHLDMTSSELIRLINQKTNIKELNVIVKADVQGSLTSVIDSLKTLDTEEVAIRIIGSGVGSLTDNDIRMAATSHAVIYGFGVNVPPNIKQLAARDKVSVRLFQIIYELLDDAKQTMSNLLTPEEIITNTGRLVVKAIFKTSKTEIICGGEVTKGRAVWPSFATIYRDKTVIAQDIQVTNLQYGPTNTKEVSEGEMCGMSLSTPHRIDLQAGDKIEIFTREMHERSL